jgi:hypothetical protein
VALTGLLALACDAGGPAARAQPSKAPSSRASANAARPAAAAPAASVVTRAPAAARVVAIGDVHGDLAATKRALKLAGVLGDDGRWSGGQAVLVQTGDILDRGDDEQSIVDLFEALAEQAKAAGGAVHVLNGNHELMNAAGDFRYVTPGGFRDFEDVAGFSPTAPELQTVPAQMRARVAAFRPGGSYARKFADQPVAMVVGDTLFAHGGVLPKHAIYGIERINQEVADWLLGRSSIGSRWVKQSDSPVWSRHFSDEPDDDDCKALEQTLATLKVKRLVVGHTVQRTIRPACDDKVWRIDVGMAAHYGGKPEALEIAGKAVKALR